MPERSSQLFTSAEDAPAVPRAAGGLARRRMKGEAREAAPPLRCVGEQRGLPRYFVEGRAHNEGSYEAPRRGRLRDAIRPQKSDAPLDTAQPQALQRAQGAPRAPSQSAPRDLAHELPAARLGPQRPEARPDAQ